MQHRDRIVRVNLVDQMRRPKYANTLLGSQSVYMRHNIGPRRHIKANRRLVAEQKSRLVKQGTGNLNPPRLAARKRRDLATVKPRHANPVKQDVRAGKRASTRHAM